MGFIYTDNFLQKLTIQHNSLRRKYAQLKEENKILRIHGTQYRKLITVQDNLMESPTASRVIILPNY